MVIASCLTWTDEEDNSKLGDVEDKIEVSQHQGDEDNMGGDNEV